MLHHHRIIIDCSKRRVDADLLRISIWKCWSTQMPESFRRRPAKWNFLTYLHTGKRKHNMKNKNDHKMKLGRERERGWLLLLLLKKRWKLTIKSQEKGEFLVNIYLFFFFCLFVSCLAKKKERTKGGMGELLRAPSSCHSTATGDLNK